MNTPIARTSGGTVECATAVVVEGPPSPGYTFRMRTTSDANNAPSPCEQETGPHGVTIDWSHELGLESASPSRGSFREWETPADRESGDDRFAVELGSTLAGNIDLIFATPTLEM